MARGTGYLGVVLGVRLANFLQHPAVGGVFVARGTMLLRLAFTEGDVERAVNRMTAETGIGFDTGQVKRFSAFLAVAIHTAGDVTVAGVTLGTIQFGVFGLVGLQLLRRTLVTTNTHIGGDVRNVQGAVRVGMTFGTGIGRGIIAVRGSVTSPTLGKGVGVFNLAGGVGVKLGVTKSTGQLMSVSLFLE